MRLSIGRYAALSAGLLIAVYGTLVLLRDPPDAPAARIPPNQLAGRSEFQRVPEAVARVPAGRAGHVFVCSEDGSGIVGARGLSSNGEVLSESDEEGMIRADAGATLIVKEGYLPLSSMWPVDGSRSEPEREVMERGALMEVAVRDVWGNPVDGATVRVNMRLPSDANTVIIEGHRHLRSPSSGNHWPCETVGSTIGGRVEVGGLGRADYSVDVSLPGWAQCWTSRDGLDIYLPLRFTCTQTRGIVKVVVCMRPVLVAAVAAAGQAEAPEGYASQFLSIGWSGSLGAVALPAYTREAKDARAMAEARLSGSGVVAGYHLLFVALTERAPPDLRPFESVAVEVVGVAETREMVAYAPYPEWTADLCTMVDASGVPEGRRVAVRAQCEPWLRATDGRIFAPLESDGDVYQFMVPDAAYKLIPSAGLCRSEDVASPLLVGPGLSGVVEADWPIGWIDVTAHDAVTDGFFLVVSSGSSRATFPWVPGRRVWVSPGTYRAMMLRDGLEESRVHEVRVTEGEGVLVKFDL